MPTPNMVSTFMATTPNDIGAINLQRHVMGLPTEDREKFINQEWEATKGFVDTVHTEKMAEAEAVLQPDKTYIFQEPEEFRLPNTGGEEVGLPQGEVEGVDIDNTNPVEVLEDPALEPEGDIEGFDDIGQLDLPDTTKFSSSVEPRDYDSAEEFVKGQGIGIDNSEMIRGVEEMKRLHWEQMKRFEKLGDNNPKAIFDGSNPNHPNNTKEGQYARIEQKDAIVEFLKGNDPVNAQIIATVKEMQDTHKKAIELGYNIDFNKKWVKKYDALVSSLNSIKDKQQQLTDIYNKAQETNE